MPARSVRVALAIGSLLLGCSGGDGTIGPTHFPIGTYVAQIFLVTPDGQLQKNVLTAGGSLSITVSESATTSGTLNVPASVTGGAALTASMAGTAIITGLTVEFDQNADTFVRDLVWDRISSTLTVTDQRAGSALFTITLLRQ